MRKLWWAWIFLSVVARAEVPPEVERYAEESRSSILKLLAEDPEMFRAAGARHHNDFTSAKYDFRNAFHAHYINPEKLAIAKEVGDVIEPEHVYYVPFCVRGKCNVIASFRFSDDDDTAQFVSAGHASLATNLKLRRKQLLASGDVNPNDALRVVFYPEKHLAFYAGVRARDEKEVLWPILYNSDLGGKTALVIDDLSELPEVHEAAPVLPTAPHVTPEPEKAIAPPSGAPVETAVQEAAVGGNQDGWWVWIVAALIAGAWGYGVYGRPRRRSSSR